MKIIVYAIAKNESKFVERWYESMKEADEIYVLDTGSTDDTVQKLKKLNVHVKKETINPWRFDVARNKSLDMVPLDSDVCVCTDLDEVFTKGWRKTLEQNIKDNNKIRYNYIWSFDKYGKPAVNFIQEKIHTRQGYKWVNPVHEVLKCSLENEKIAIIEEITLNHYPDNEKSRSGYLPLLELAVKEDPTNDRNMHYLGREYMFYHKWNESITTLKKHLKMANATWDAERSASMRFISTCYQQLNDYNEAIKYSIMSIAEAPYLREGYFQTGKIYYELKDYEKSISYFELALMIKENPKSYINDPNCYNGQIEDLLSVSYYYNEEYLLALKYVEKALKLDSENERIKNNKKFILEKIV